jgi:hypothetical protein
MSRILIVEDDPAILVGLKDNLEFEGRRRPRVCPTMKPRTYRIPSSGQ